MSEDVSVELPLESKAFLDAYKKAKENQAFHESEAERWKSAAMAIEDTITPLLQDANIGIVDGRRTCKLTRWMHPQFNVRAFKEKEPDLYEEYVERQPRKRFTVYGDE